MKIEFDTLLKNHMWELVPHTPTKRIDPVSGFLRSKEMQMGTLIDTKYAWLQKASLKGPALIARRHLARSSSLPRSISSFQWHFATTGTSVNLMSTMLTSRMTGTKRCTWHILRGLLVMTSRLTSVSCTR